ncbi:MAG: UDPGP type 1 family protein [Eubacterium sp.]|nr:UDPGP type 1 family protein [Eubacterium sp.]
MSYEQAKSLLEKYGQTQLLKYYDELNDSQKESLLKQISEIDFGLLDLVKDGESVSEKGVITPLDDAVSIKDIEENKEKYTAIGVDAIKQGKVAALLLAGGMGTRLGSDKPKGMYNIGETKDVYIFEMLIRNLLDVVNQTGAWVPLYIMTSEKNNDDTVNFFKEKNYFGYDPDYVDFFVQEMAPAATFDGKIYLEEKDRVSTSPNGNGGWFISFVKAGLCEKAKARGVEYINIFAVDNVCQRMADPCFVGAMIDGGYRSASKVVSKANPEEKVGVLCLEDGKPSIVEYYELTEDMRYETRDDGELAYKYGVILNYLFTIEDLEKNLKNNLVVHIVKKKIPYIDENGNTVKPVTENGYKFETLVLDMIHMMDNCLAYEVVREKEFAPIKNKTGVDSVDTAKALLKQNGVEL